ncbi:MAG: creatininase family protein [Anaerolineae bacterium]|nr:creatininase family protein [Anaerolineae bacterium]
MFWEELTSDHFERAVEQVERVCLLPLACIERHAHHLPLATDMFIGRDLCRRAAALETALIFPNFVFTEILEARHCPGTVALEPDLIVRLLDNVCREIARNGLTKIVLVSAHGGNYHFLRFFAQSQLASRRDYVVYVADPSLLPEDGTDVESQWETKVDGHAGEQETSMMLAIRPELVVREALRTDTEGMPLERLKALSELGVYTGIWWYADHPTHYRGEGNPATAEKGELLLAAQARALAAAIRLIKQDSKTHRLQAEFYAAAEPKG